MIKFDCMTDEKIKQAFKTIRTQQSEIERLKGQRDRLLEIVNSLSEVDICNSQHHGKKDRHINVCDCPIVKRAKSLIAEIEAEK